jgi:putative SOS response-associated peptidase YedK
VEPDPVDQRLQCRARDQVLYIVANSQGNRRLANAAGAEQCHEPLFSMTTNQQAIRNLFKVTLDTAGNLPPLPAIFPDHVAPIVRSSGDQRELTMARWGMPNPPQFPGISTNIRNVSSPHWRRWLKPESRCLVPATSFSEYNDIANPKSLKDDTGAPHPMAGKKDVVWFALSPERPLFAFAGIWTDWTGTRGIKANPVEGDHPALWIPHHRTERHRRARSRQSDAGAADDCGGMRCLDARAVERSRGAAAATARRRNGGRGARREQGGRRTSQ